MSTKPAMNCRYQIYILNYFYTIMNERDISEILFLWIYIISCIFL